MTDKKQTESPRLMSYSERCGIENEFDTHPVCSDRSAICGYMRLFSRENNNNYMLGTCSFSKEPCRRELPMNTEECPVYKEWLEGRGEPAPILELTKKDLREFKKRMRSHR